jgi:hypothetical protein
VSVPYTGNFFGQRPIADAFVESHPFAKCAKGWGARRLISCMRKADSSPLRRVRNDKVLWSGIAAVGWVRCPESEKSRSLDFARDDNFSCWAMVFSHPVNACSIWTARLKSCPDTKSFAGGGRPSPRGQKQSQRRRSECPSTHGQQLRSTSHLGCICGIPLLANAARNGAPVG